MYGKRKRFFGQDEDQAYWDAYYAALSGQGDYGYYDYPQPPIDDGLNPLDLAMSYLPDDWFQSDPNYDPIQEAQAQIQLASQMQMNMNDIYNSLQATMYENYINDFNEKWMNTDAMSDEDLSSMLSKAFGVPKMSGEQARSMADTIAKAMGSSNGGGFSFGSSGQQALKTYGQQGQTPSTLPKIYPNNLQSSQASIFGGNTIILLAIGGIAAYALFGRK
jgi:hypothetical protein